MLTTEVINNKFNFFSSNVSEFSWILFRKCIPNHYFNALNYCLPNANLVSQQQLTYSTTSEGQSRNWKKKKRKEFSCYKSQHHCVLATTIDSTPHNGHLVSFLFCEWLFNRMEPINYAINKFSHRQMTHTIIYAKYNMSSIRLNVWVFFLFSLPNDNKTNWKFKWTALCAWVCGIQRIGIVHSLVTTQ